MVVLSNLSRIRFKPWPIVIVGVAIFSLAVSVRVAAEGSAPAAAWRHFRGDDGLTGRALVQGRIDTPAVVWTFNANSRETLFEAQLDGSGQQSAALPRDDISPPADLEHVWNLGGRWLDLDGDGKLHRTTGKVGEILTASSGLERVEIESDVNRGQPVIARLFGRENGNWVELWMRPRSDVEEWTETVVGAPVPIAGDFDGDGRVEIAFQGFYWIYILDAETGALKTKARFLESSEAESGRGYGWFGACDFDSDGKTELVILGDTQNLIAVMGWDENGNLVRRWIKIINYDAYRRISVVKPGMSPLHDLDGDGQEEIVLSIFNYDPSDSGRLDDRWHTWALNGLNGNLHLDLKNEFLSGVRDFDGDGVSEVLTTEAPALLVPDPSTLSIYSMKRGQLTKRWKRDGESFQLTSCSDLPLSANSSAAGDRTDLLAGPSGPSGRPVFCTKRVVDRATPTIQITTWQFDDSGTPQALGRLIGPDLEVLSIRQASDSHASLLVQTRSSDAPASLVHDGFRVSSIASSRKGAPMSPVAMGRLRPHEKPAVVVEGSGEQIVAFRPYDDTDHPIWRKPGRGMSTGGGHSIGWADRGGIVLADLLGDGCLATVAATKGPVNQARLVAYDPDGNELWHRDFDQVPGDIPAHNSAGLTMWFSGRFTDAKKHDMLATPRPKSQEEAFLLRGNDGSIIWRRERVGPHGADDARPVGGTWLASADFNGNDLDDVIGMYPDLFYSLDGTTGELQISRDSSALFPDSPIKPYNAMPVVADFFNRGNSQYLWGACDRAFGLLNPCGKTVWHVQSPLPRGPGILPGIGDVDGDGELEILVVGHNDAGKSSLVCRASRSGEVKWLLPLPGDTFIDIFATENTPMPPATADLNGDGRDECVFTIGTTVYAASAIPDGKRGEISWQIDLPQSGRLGPPAIGDASGAGRAEVVVMGRDGVVYGIGDANGETVRSRKTTTEP